MFNISDKDIRVLLVDDDEMQLNILKTRFVTSLDSYSIKEFTSGELLLDFLSGSQFSLNSVYIVVLDYFLKTRENPHAKDGPEILSIIKKKYPSVEVIMLSGYDEENFNQVVAEMKSKGAIDLVKKSEDCYTRIQNVINRIISESVFKRKKRERNIAIFGFVSFLIITIIVLAIIAYF